MKYGRGLKGFNTVFRRWILCLNNINFRQYLYIKVWQNLDFRILNIPNNKWFISMSHPSLIFRVTNTMVHENVDDFILFNINS